MTRVLLVLLLFGFCGSARALTDAQELALAKRVAPQLEAQLGGVLPKNNRLSRRVRRVGAPLARLVTRSIRPTYAVLDNEDMLNAFAGPGGRVYITSRLVRMAETDAELAAVLAHETGHVQNRDMAQRYEQHENAQKQMRTVSRALLGNMVKTGENSFLSLGTSVAFLLMRQGYSREKESEADAYASRALCRVGYDPNAAITILQKLSYQKQLDGNDSPVLATHPDLAVRCADLRALIAREKLVPAEGKPAGKHKKRKRRLRRR